MIDDACETQTVVRNKKQKAKWTVTATDCVYLWTKFRKICKKIGHGRIQYDPDGIHCFTGNVVLDENVTSLVMPLQFFCYFFTDEIIQYIAGQTALYSVQQFPNNPLVITKADTERFIGIAMSISCQTCK